MYSAQVFSFVSFFIWCILVNDMHIRYQMLALTIFCSLILKRNKNQIRLYILVRVNI